MKTTPRTRLHSARLALALCLLAAGCKSEKKLPAPDPYHEPRNKAPSVHKGGGAATQPSGAKASGEAGSSAGAGSAANAANSADPAKPAQPAPAPGGAANMTTPAAEAARAPATMKPSTTPTAVPSSPAAVSTPRSAQPPIAAGSPPAMREARPADASRPYDGTPAAGVAPAGASQGASRTPTAKPGSSTASAAVAPGQASARGPQSSVAARAPAAGGGAPAQASAKVQIAPAPAHAGGAATAARVPAPGLAGTASPASPAPAPAVASSVSLERGLPSTRGEAQPVRMPGASPAEAAREPAGLVTRFLDAVEPASPATGTRAPAKGQGLAAALPAATRPASEGLPSAGVGVPGALAAGSPRSAPGTSASVALASLARGSSAFVAIWSAEQPRGVAMSRAEAVRVVSSRPGGQFVVVDLPGQAAEAWKRVIERANAALGAIDWVAPAGADEAERRERLARRAVEQEADLAAREKLSHSVFQFLLSPQTRPAGEAGRQQP